MRPTSPAAARHRQDAVEWAKEGVERGAGEILLTSMDRDGTKDGYELTLTGRSPGRRRAVIASGGVGTPQHLVEGLQAGADAVLAASIFHYGTYRIAEVKEALAAAGFPMRPYCLRPERVQRRVAGQEDRPAVGDHRVERAAAHVEDLLPVRAPSPVVSFLP